MLISDIIHYSVSDNIYMYFQLHDNYVQPTAESIIQPYYCLGNTQWAVVLLSI